MPKHHKVKITSEEEAAAQTEQSAPVTDQPVATADVEAQLAEAQARVQELNDKYLRTLADFDNFRRRTRQERANAMRDGESGILLEVLPLLDNFARALQAAQGSNDVRALMDGVRMGYDQLHAALERKGVRAIEAEGKPFDPLYHDAVGRLETAEYPEGTVAVEVQKGYQLGDRVLRPSRVMVAVKPAGQAGGSSSPAREER